MTFLKTIPHVSVYTVRKKNERKKKFPVISELCASTGHSIKRWRYNVTPGCREPASISFWQVLDSVETTVAQSCQTHNQRHQQQLTWKEQQLVWKEQQLVWKEQH